MLHENSEKDDSNHTDYPITTEGIVEIIKDMAQFKNCCANDESDWLSGDEDDRGVQTT